MNYLIENDESILIGIVELLLVVNMIVALEKQRPTQL